MKVYKATDKDMKCRGFQYDIGKTAEVDGDAKLCERGLHACEMPLDVLGYYAPGDGSRYFEADLYRQYKRDTARAMSILKARKPMRDVLKAAGRPV